MTIPIRHTHFGDMATVEQALVVTIAKDRSEKWRKFLEPGPLLEAWWFNEIVDWLVKTYPGEFKLKGVSNGNNGEVSKGIKVRH